MAAQGRGSRARRAARREWRRGGGTHEVDWANLPDVAWDRQHAKERVAKGRRGQTPPTPQPGPVGSDEARQAQRAANLEPKTTTHGQTIHQRVKMRTEVVHRDTRADRPGSWPRTRTEAESHDTRADHPGQRAEDAHGSDGHDTRADHLFIGLRCARKWQISRHTGSPP